MNKDNRLPQPIPTFFPVDLIKRADLLHARLGRLNRWIKHLGVHPVFSGIRLGKGNGLAFQIGNLVGVTGVVMGALD